jgi:hypothetical protein
MSSLVSALDKHTPKQIGENNHVEYTWSNDINEKIVQFFFQLVRNSSLDSISKQHKQILMQIKNRESQFKEQFTMMYKLIGQTRDIVTGKGEQQLSYMQIFNFYNCGYEELAHKAFEKMVFIDNEHPYGSWKDVKYFCKYIKMNTAENGDSIKKHPLVVQSCLTIIEQLKKDYSEYKKWEASKEEYGPLNISLAARWVPREKSSFGWVNAIIAELMFSELFYVNMPKHIFENALLKAKIRLKKIFTPLNKHLKTVQINQCSKDWSSIDFNNVTSCTMRKQSKAFLNVDKKNSQRSSEDDRIQCAKNFKSHIEAAKSDSTNHKVRGQRCGVGELTRDAISCSNSSEIDRINLQWEDNRKNNMGLGNIIPCCDTSGSMECDNMTPLVNAIGLSIRASEVVDDAFKNRILTFSNQPRWIQLNDSQTFVDKVRTVKAASDWGMNTNIKAMFDLIINIIIKNEIPPSKVENLTLAIFSDMQIDSAVKIDYNSGITDFKGYMNTLYDDIRQQFHEAGLKSRFKKPYSPPHIVFWNLRLTNGFPVLSTEKNVSMLSGYSSQLLNIFCNKGVDAIKESTPMKLLIDILDDERYSYMENDIKAFFQYKKK